MKTSELSIQDKLRANSVKRWHIVDTARTQTVAEHSFNVALIAVEIAKRGLGMDDNSPYVTKLAYMAIHHDLDEVITGDIPSQNKEPYDFSGPVSAETVLKMADIIEALWFIGGNRTGNRHGEAVFNYCAEMYGKMCSSLPVYISGVAKQVYDDLINGEFQIEPRG